MQMKESAHLLMKNSRGKPHNSLSSTSPSQLRPWPFIRNHGQDFILTTSLAQNIVIIFARNVICMDISNGIVHDMFVIAVKVIVVTNPKLVNALTKALTKLL